MPSITGDPHIHTIIVTVDADPQNLPELEQHARIGLGVFGRYPGFYGGATHVSEDGSRMVQYLQWSSPEAYEACLEDPAWDALPSTSVFMHAVRAGSAQVDVRSYRVVAVSREPTLSEERSEDEHPPDDPPRPSAEGPAGPPTE